MELRFLEGNFEHGKFKLQYRKPEMPPPNMCGSGIFYGEWTDVPCVKEEPKKWCEHFYLDVYNKIPWWRCKDSNEAALASYNFCPVCGTPKP